MGNRRGSLFRCSNDSSTSCRVVEVDTTGKHVLQYCTVFSYECSFVNCINFSYMYESIVVVVVNFTIIIIIHVYICRIIQDYTCTGKLFLEPKTYKA